MVKKIRSLLDELDSFTPSKNKYEIVEARANHFIVSGINLINRIEEQFTPQEADELVRRLFNSLKNRDADKFAKKVRQLKESKSQEDEQ